MRPHGKHFFCAERFGRLRSYVRPGGAAHMSAGPDEVRRPESSSCLTTGCFWSSVATVSLIAFQCACQTSNCDLCNCSVDMLQICLQEGRRPYAFANISARKISPVLIIAQMIRASLLASATVTRRAGFFARSALSQPASAPLRLLTLRSSEVTERTSSFLMWRFPCLLMPPSVCLPPLEFCRGVSPSQAAKSRPDPTRSDRALTL